jgi:hypothetical protein
MTKELLDRLRLGDHLSDEELEDGIVHFKNLCEMLEVHGALYNLTWLHAYGELRKLESFYNHRASRKLKTYEK